MTKPGMRQAFSTRLARVRTNQASKPLFRWIGNRGAATLALGAVLSIGGIAETFDSVHFLLQKDLDSVRVVKEQGDDCKVVAQLKDGFAANSLFKLSRALPERLVTRQIALFDDRWMPEDGSSHGQSVFRAEMTRINHAIHREFFANAMPFGSIIHEKAQKYDVDPALVAAVIETESRFRTRARSQVGARGLMQLMPRTGRWLGADDLYDPEQNVDAGVKYLKYLQARFDGNLSQAIAAYNAGEGNVKRYGGVPPFRETQSYVRKVMHSYRKRNEQIKAYDEQHGNGTADGESILTVR